MNNDSQFLDQIRAINVHKSGERRAPHKPLLLLIAIAGLLQGKRGSRGHLKTSVPFKCPHNSHLPFVFIIATISTLDLFCYDF
jgi:hypothetical protein